MSEDELSVTPSALWEQITRVPRPSREVEFPRKDPETGEPVATVLMCVLTQDETQNCATAADLYVRKALRENPVGKDEYSRGYDDLYNNELSVQIIARAVRDVKDQKRHVFPSPKAIRGYMTQGEMGVLMRQYLLVQAELGPVIAEMSAEEMESWVRRLVEGGSGHPLAFLSSDGLTELILLMAYRLYPYLTATTSPGERPGESPSSEADDGVGGGDTFVEIEVPMPEDVPPDA